MINAVEEKYLEHSVSFIKSGEIKTPEDFVDMVKDKFSYLLRDHLKLQAVNQILLKAKTSLSLLGETPPEKLQRLIQETQKLSLDYYDKWQEMKRKAKELLKDIK